MRCSAVCVVVLGACARQALRAQAPERETGASAVQDGATGNAARIAEGRALLARVIAAQANVAQLTAAYEQFRSTPLTKQPLRSTGTLAFRRDPGCVVFAVREPRTSTIRLEGRTYEVWHPDKNRLERFVLPSDELPRLLFDALAPTAQRMDKDFTVTDCEPVEGAPAQRRLTLLPHDTKAQQMATHIALFVESEGPRLCGFGYRDPRGGDVRVQLHDVQTSDKADAKLFTLDVPANTKVVVQEVPSEKAPAEKEPAKDGQATKK